MLLKSARNYQTILPMVVVETFITKKEHLKYSNYAPQYKINQGSLFTRCHLTGEEENLHLGVASRSSGRSLSLGSRTACQKAGLSLLPPRAPCTSPVHLPAALLGLLHPGGGKVSTAKGRKTKPSRRQSSTVSLNFLFTAFSRASPARAAAPETLEGQSLSHRWHFPSHLSSAGW